MPAPVLFGEADLENDFLGESSSSCSYAPPAPVSAIEDLRTQDDEPAHDAGKITLRAPPPSAALLELSGVADEPLRETREHIRRALRSVGPERDIAPESTRVTEPPPASIEEALIRAARTSFASEPPRTGDRPSGVRVSAPHTIEEAVLRVIEREQPEAQEPLRERKIPNA